MFISEVSESRHCGLPYNTTQSEVTASNYHFSNVMSKVSMKDVVTIHSNVVAYYGVLRDISEVVKYNYDRLYLNI